MDTGIASSLLLAIALGFSGIRKLTRAPAVVESYRRAGVPEQRLPLLATIVLAAAAGLVAGIAVPQLSVITAACLVAYFGVAIAFHVRNGDAEHLPSPIAHLALAVIVLVLRAGAP